MQIEKLPSDLQALLRGQVPDAEWQFLPTARTIESWQKAVSQWTYMPEKFMAASRNVYCAIPMLPTLAWLTLTTGRVPSLSAAIKVIKSLPARCYSVDARAYQCHTGWLREVHVGMILAEHGQVFKNPRMDLKQGVDWIFRKDGKELLIAIAHEGRTSRANWQRRKCHKLAAGAVVLTARGSEGVALVASSDILSAINSATISASSSAAR